ncbi:helix-turn-helix domain-containing protein [Bradyrhizobium cenepequi]
MLRIPPRLAKDYVSRRPVPIFPATRKGDSGTANAERSNVMALDIAEVAQRAGIPASTIRFYEEKGLITSTGRRGLRRVFDAPVLDRLALIALGRAAGFSLDEIGLMFALDGRPGIDPKILSAKAGELDKTIRRLSAMRDALRHAAVCPKPSHTECARFRQKLRTAASGAAGSRKKQFRLP